MKIIMLFVLFLVGYSKLYAQETRIDSVTIKRKIAFTEARQFKSTKAIRVAKRKRHLLNTSDYFAPKVTAVSNLSFLKDSVYVKAYKDAAYNRSVNGSIRHIHYTADLSTERIVKVVVVSAVVVVAVVLFLRFITNNLVVK